MGVNSRIDLKRKKAKFAFQRIKKVEDECEKEDLKKFKANIKDVPMYIYTNGLIATLAFINKKANTEKAYEEIENILIEYMANISDELKCKDINKILAGLIECEGKKYRRMTLAVLSILEWLINFSDAIVVEGELDEEE